VGEKGTVEFVNPNHARMTIGEFSRRTRLSARALRLCDAQGLLVPAAVDPYTGYRHYTHDQLGRAHRIGLLRAAGMPLAEIAELLDLSAEDADRALTAWWRGVEGRHRAQRALVAYLRTVIIGRSDDMYDVHTREVPEQKVLTLSRRLTVTELDGFLTDGLAAMREHLTAQGASPAGPHVVIFHNPVDHESTARWRSACPSRAGSSRPARWRYGSSPRMPRRTPRCRDARSTTQRCCGRTTRSRSGCAGTTYG
jgi:DNA-binding transcriptional MerR regulator